jgi:DNA-binding transcriptional MerR regulator
MTIKEACTKTGLTRKAVRYYESAGLISPEADANGYRNYSGEVIRDLHLIAILRSFGLSIEEIRICLQGEEDLSTQLRKKMGAIREELQRRSVDLQLLQKFLDGDRSLEHVIESRNHIEKTLQDRPGYLGERLRRVFPGDLGDLLAVVYGGMLDRKLETPEQHAAWLSLVSDLDQMEEIEVPDEIAEWARKRNETRRVVEHVTRLREEYSQDYQAFSDAKRRAGDAYVAETSENERTEYAEDAQKLVAFLAGPGLPLTTAVGKYLPLLSTFVADFGEKSRRFAAENPELLRRMTGSTE